MTFEYSTDNVNYTSLGNGTATGSNWTLTGLNLPNGQNIYIRARGFYRSGDTTARRASRNPCGMLMLQFRVPTSVLWLSHRHLQQLLRAVQFPAPSLPQLSQASPKVIHLSLFSVRTSPDVFIYGSGLPDGASGSFTVNPTTTGNSTTLNINLGTTAPGIYRISVTSPQLPQTADMVLNIIPAYAAQIQQPINADGTSVFNVRRGVVPVKFTLTIDGVATCALPAATIALTRTEGGTIGTDQRVRLHQLRRHRVKLQN